MASWDDEDFDEAPSASNGIKLTDKWEGEDEEIVDDWDKDDEDEEKKDGQTTAESEAASKRRRNLKEVIKEKEEKRLQELAKKKAAAAEAEANDNMTPEQIRRAQEESDLLLAKEAFGVSDAPAPVLDTERSIDAQNPKSREDFEKLQSLLLEKLRNYEKSPQFPMFLENLFRDISLNQDAEVVRKFSTMFAAMANEKVKQQKGKKKKGAAKGKIATIRENDFVNDANPPELDEFDDFM